MTWENKGKGDMANECFIMDTRGHYGPDFFLNHGLAARRDLFIESKTTADTGTDKWKREPVPIWGVLTTDFDSLKKGTLYVFQFKRLLFINQSCRTDP